VRHEIIEGVNMYLHFKSVNAADYFERRDLPYPRSSKLAHYGPTYRLAHINMCLALRSVYRAAGPLPDGTGAEIFFDVADQNELEERLRDDPYVIGGIWTSWSFRPLVEILVPTEQPPVCLDGSRVVTAVEATVSDGSLAMNALRYLRDEGLLAVGGVTVDGIAIAWLPCSGYQKASQLLRQQKIHLTGDLRTHSIVWVL
jgi:hypothetical protein